MTNTHGKRVPPVLNSDAELAREALEAAIKIEELYLTGELRAFSSLKNYAQNLYGLNMWERRDIIRKALEAMASRDDQNRPTINGQIAKTAETDGNYRRVTGWMQVSGESVPIYEVLHLKAGDQYIDAPFAL